MSDEPDEATEATAATAATEPVASARRESGWERRRRLAEVFGDVLPDTTRDERDQDRPEGGAAESAQDRWLKSQVPPHHG